MLGNSLNCLIRRILHPGFPLVHSYFFDDINSFKCCALPSELRDRFNKVKQWQGSTAPIQFLLTWVLTVTHFRIQSFNLVWFGLLNLKILKSLSPYPGSWSFISNICFFFRFVSNIIKRNIRLFQNFISFWKELCRRRPLIIWIESGNNFFRSH